MVLVEEERDKEAMPQTVPVYKLKLEKDSRFIVICYQQTASGVKHWLYAFEHDPL